MKKLSMLMAALCAGMLFGAEFPDFSKAETWKKSDWTKSIYNYSDGVMTIMRPEGVVPNGSGAWRSVAFPVKAGETISVSVDAHYVEKGETGKVRLGLDTLDASGKRVKFLDDPRQFLNEMTAGFETKNHSFTIPQGATQAVIYLCIDAFGKVEFKNIVVK